MRLIDAHKLEKEFKRIYNVTQNCQSLDWGTVKNTIRDQPEVDPVKHGHWISNDDTFDTCRCSQCDCFSEAKYPYCCYCGSKMGRNKVIHKAQPTVDPMKHAHWTEKYIGGMFLWECSICNARAIIKSNYCPHCGAKMDEVIEWKEVM